MAYIPLSRQLEIGRLFEVFREHSLPVGQAVDNLTLMVRFPKTPVEAYKRLLEKLLYKLNSGGKSPVRHHFQGNSLTRLYRLNQTLEVHSLHIGIYSILQ